MNVIRREPALISGAVLAVLALAVAFGLDLSSEKVGAIMAVVAAFLAIITRAAVTPNVSVAASVIQGEVVAGPASPIQDGTPVNVQDVTSLPPLPPAL